MDFDLDEDAPSPIAAVVIGLTEFLDETAEDAREGWVRVERMTIAMPVEFYVRPGPNGSGRVAALETRPASRTLTSVRPVLHGLSLVVEVDRAQQREPGMES